MPGKKSSFIIRSLVVAGAGWLTLLIWWSRPPGDAQLVKRFDQHRAAFVELREMFLTYTKGGIRQSTENEVWPMAKYQRYKELLKQAHVMRFFWERGALNFQIAGSKTLTSGHRIAVTWIGTTPDRVVSNLDDFEKTARPGDHAYRPLGGGWYLYMVN